MPARQPAGSPLIASASGARIAGRRSLDRARLRADLTTRLDAAEADALLTNATVTGADYERLTVSPRKDPIS